MSRGTIALVAVLLLGACHRQETGAAALDASADQRNQTEAKTLADLAAADRATAAPAAQRDR